MTQDSFDIGARLYTTTSTPLPPSPDQIAEAAYGPKLVATTNLLLTRHTTPLPADINNDGVIDPANELFYVYFSREKLLWSRLLDVGPGAPPVVITHSGVGFLYGQVEDCYLNRLTLAEGGTVTIGQGALQVNDGATAAPNLLFRLDNPPATGTLKLDGAPLSAGGLFTQADINNNRLTYTHNGGETTADSFAYSVSGMTRVSAGPGGAEGNNDSSAPALSSNGRYVAFESLASNLVASDSNGVSDIFLYNLRTGQTTRESVGPGGAQANGASEAPSISSSGSNLAFESAATNLVDPVTDCIILNGQNAARHIFWRATGSLTQRFSVSSTAFSECYRGNGNSSAAAIAPDGLHVAFQSVATNLLVEQDAPSPDPPGGGGRTDTNNASDIFQHTTGDFTSLLSLVSQFPDPYDQANADSSDPAISTSGEHVAFTSLATDLLGPGVDDNDVPDIYVRTSSGNVRVSVSTAGAQAIGIIGPPPFFFRLGSHEPSISEDGRYVAFYSWAANLVNNDSNARTDIFVRDRDTEGDGIYDEGGAVSTTRVSLANGGAQADGHSSSPAISAHGRYVAFESDATNLVSGDTLGHRDIFVRDRLTNQTTRVSVAANGAEADGDSINPSISADGSYIAFESVATNLVSGDTLGKRDVFVRYVGFSSTFPIAITPVNDAPTVATIANQSVVIGTSTGPIVFSIGDADTDVLSLTVQVSSSNPTLIPASALVLGGSGANRTLTVTPAGSVSRPTDVTITITVGDGAATTTRSFTLRVIPYQVRIPLAVR